MNILFIVNSAALGVGLAMDAFSVSLANGLREPRMGRARMCAIAGVYASGSVCGLSWKFFSFWRR